MAKKKVAAFVKIQIEAGKASPAPPVGTALGLLYWGTGSLWAAVAVHSVYDALWCFTPFTASPAPWGWGTGLQIAATLALAGWAWSLHHRGNTETK